MRELTRLELASQIGPFGERTHINLKGADTIGTHILGDWSVDQKVGVSGGRLLRFERGLHSNSGRPNWGREIVRSKGGIINEATGLVLLPGGIGGSTKKRGAGQKTHTWRLGGANEPGGDCGGEAIYGQSRGIEIGVFRC